MSAQITVVIPVRNRAGIRLENCLRSLRWQDLPQDQIAIVVSDFGSNPADAASIAGLAERYGARVIQTATQEVWNRSRALNIGLRACTTPWVLCTDADMIFLPNFVSSVLAQLEDNPKPGIVFCRCSDLPEDVPEQLRDPSDIAWLQSKATLRQTSGTGACQAAALQFFQHARGYDEAFVYWGAEDDDMRLRALRHGLEPRWVSPQTAMFHQWHPTMKADRPLTRLYNKWRYKLTSHQVVKNKRSWGLLP